jgi:GTPase SAR1 family protein
VNPDIPVVLVGNKSDLPNRAIEKDEAQNLADSLGYRFFETSAKEMYGVQEMLDYIIRKAVENKDNRSSFHKGKKIRSGGKKISNKPSRHSRC